MYKVYLSGPIAGLTFDGANDWREYVNTKAHPNITCLSPLRAKEWLRDHGTIGKTQYDRHTARDEFIGLRDHWDTIRADLMLVNLLGAKNVSIGTMIEIGIAHHARTPIFLVIEPTSIIRDTHAQIVENFSNVHDHPMVRAYSNMRFDKMDEAIETMNALLAVWNLRCRCAGAIHALLHRAALLRV